MRLFSPPLVHIVLFMLIYEANSFWINGIQYVRSKYIFSSIGNFIVGNRFSTTQFFFLVGLFLQRRFLFLIKRFYILESESVTLNDTLASPRNIWLLFV